MYFGKYWQIYITVLISEIHYIIFDRLLSAHYDIIKIVLLNNNPIF